MNVHPLEGEWVFVALAQEYANISLSHNAAFALEALIRKRDLTVLA